MQTDLQSVGAVTARYRDLQGLRLVAGGLASLVVCAWTLFFPVTPADIRTSGLGLTLWGLGLLIVDAAAVIVVARALATWYDRRYGRVSYSRGQARVTALLAGAGLASSLIPFQLEIVALNAHSAVPFNVMLFGISVWIVAYWLYLGREFHHYLAIACCGFALTLVSVAGIPPAGLVWHIREATLFLGIVSIVGGLIDHRTLTRALGPPNSHVVDS